MARTPTLSARGRSRPERGRISPSRTTARTCGSTRTALSFDVDSHGADRNVVQPASDRRRQPLRPVLLRPHRRGARSTTRLSRSVRSTPTWELPSAGSTRRRHRPISLRRSSAGRRSTSPGVPPPRARASPTTGSNDAQVSAARRSFRSRTPRRRVTTTRVCPPRPRIRTASGRSTPRGRSGRTRTPPQPSPGCSVTPRQVALTPGQTQQYTATLPGGGAPTVTWSVDGIVGRLGPTSGRSRAAASTRRRRPRARTRSPRRRPIRPSRQRDRLHRRDYAGMFTLPQRQHADGAEPERDGPHAGERQPVELRQALLAPARRHRATPRRSTSRTSRSRGRGRTTSSTSRPSTTASTRTTPTGDRATPLWKDSFIDPAHGVTTVPADDTGECCDIAPEIGITSTPVIDRARTRSTSSRRRRRSSAGQTNYVQRLHALDITTGAEKFGGPVVIQASVPGTGAGSHGRPRPVRPAAREPADGAPPAERRRLLRLREPRRRPAVPRLGHRLQRDDAAADTGLLRHSRPGGRGRLDERRRHRHRLDRRRSTSSPATASSTAPAEWGDSYIKLTTAGAVAGLLHAVQPGRARTRGTMTSAPAARCCSPISPARTRT